MLTSLDSKPTDEMVNAFLFAGILIVKLPLASVWVLILVPLTETVAATTGVLSSVFFTDPTTVRCCAKTKREKTEKHNAKHTRIAVSFFDSIAMVLKLIINRQ